MFNVVRKYPAPLSLSAQKSYSGEDVWLTLQEIFFHKCYLCETKQPTDINVEHLRPHAQDLALKYSWENLYYACSRCNNLKLDGFKEILDCADPNIDVFRKIKILPPHSYQGHIIISATDSQSETLETVELLSRIYNNPTTINKTITCAHLKNNIFKKYTSLTESMRQYLDDESTASEKQHSLEKLQTLMKKEQAFSALLRWVVLEDSYFKPLLETYMD